MTLFLCVYVSKTLCLVCYENVSSISDLREYRRRVSMQLYISCSLFLCVCVCNGDDNNNDEDRSIDQSTNLRVPCLVEARCA